MLLRRLKRRATHPGRLPSGEFSHVLTARTSPAGRLQSASDSNDRAAYCGSLLFAKADADFFDADDGDMISPSAVGS